MDELMEIKKGLWISFWKDFFLGPGMVILVFLALLVFTYVFVHGGRAPEVKYFEADGHEYVEFPGYCTGFTHSPKCKCLQMPESKPIKNTSRIVNTKKEGKETYVVPTEVIR